MDYFAVNNYELPIELMMENAGLQLANLITASINGDKTKNILIGVGNGNNGGGGLVAARRLAAWGFTVHLDVFTNITKPLPSTQLKRALKFGAKTTYLPKPDVWIDAYLGFSQRLPLSKKLLTIIQTANNSAALKIALDIPSGFLGDNTLPYFKADKVLTLAAPKKILYQLLPTSQIFVADLGIPELVYTQFGITLPPFNKGNILLLER